MIVLLLAALSMAGVIPSALNGVSRIAWVDAELTGTATCQAMDASHWQCDGLPDPARGIVAMIGDGTLAYQCVNACDQAAGNTSSVWSWGRLIILTPGGVAPDDLHDIRLSAWKPDRSRVRSNLRRFLPVADSGGDIIPLSSSAFWLAGHATDRDAFIDIDGPAIGSQRVSISKIAEGPPEVPLFVAAAAPLTLAGRVQAAGAQGVEGSDIELYEPLETVERADAVESLPMIRRRQARSGAGGAFALERIAAGFYLVVTTDSSFGRATARVDSVAEPLTITLAALRRATGRVLKNRLPVAGARVRFVPTAEAFIASRDPSTLIAEEGTTGSDGRFSLALPPSLHGVVQVVGPDSTSVRVPLFESRLRDISIGDIELPEHRKFTIRLIDDEACTLSAIGPLGSLGFTIVRATASGATHWFDMPEAGEWALDADCGNQRYVVLPTIVTIPAMGPLPTVDVRLVK